MRCVHPAASSDLLLERPPKDITSASMWRGPFKTWGVVCRDCGNKLLKADLVVTLQTRSGGRLFWKSEFAMTIGTAIIKGGYEDRQQDAVSNGAAASDPAVPETES